MNTIAIDCRMLNCSGIGSFLKGILPNLLKHRHNKWLLIGDPAQLEKYRSANVEILNCSIPIFSIKELFSFPVKYVNRCSAFFTPNYNIPMGIKIPVYATIHDTVYLDIPGLTSKVGTLIRTQYLRLAISRANHIFTVSNFSANRILHHFPTIKPPTVCYNGVASTLAEANAEKLPQELSAKPYFIYVGNIKPHKGLSTLLQAFENLSDKATLVIVGSKDNFRTSDKTISRQLSDADKSSNIIFTGHVSDGLLKALITNAAALIQPSRYEGFGLPPLEAMQLGTPAIISDIEVFKELYSDFPVTFFKTGDADSLSHAIKNFIPCRIKIPGNLSDKYTYDHSAKIIYSIIEQESGSDSDSYSITNNNPYNQATT